MTAKVLLIEDALDMQLIVRRSVEDLCDLSVVGSIAEARTALLDSTYALLILDGVLPDGDGFDLCRELRARGNHVPVIFLTGRTTVAARVQGLESGGDDYVLKPFAPEEFRARVQVALRRATAQSAETSFSRGEFRVDWSLQKAFLRSDDQEQELGLTPIEFKLLAHFLRHEGQVFSREELLVAVWGARVSVSTNTVDTHISSLRKKIGDYGRLLRAVIRKGYCFSLNDRIAG